MKKLSSRTIYLGVFLLLAIIGNTFFKLVYKPTHARIARLKMELATLEGDVINKQIEVPDTRAEQGGMEREKRSLESLKVQLTNMESLLPSQDDLPELLSGLLKPSERYLMDINLVKPVEDDQKADYTRLNIEMHYDASYLSTVNYLRQLENVFQFIAPQRILIENNIEEDEAQLNVKMFLSTVLVDAKTTALKLSNQIASQRGQDSLVLIKRDPFVSEFIPIAPVDEVKDQQGDMEEKIYKLSGIINKGELSTVIIDNEVYRVGDWLDERQIQTISLGKVILKNDRDSLVLTIDEE